MSVSKHLQIIKRDVRREGDLNPSYRRMVMDRWETDEWEEAVTLEAQDRLAVLMGLATRPAGGDSMDR